MTKMSGSPISGRRKILSISDSEEKTADEGQKKRQKKGKFCPDDEGEKKIGPDGEQFAMGEIKHTGRFEYHDKSHRRESIEKTY